MKNMKYVYGPVPSRRLGISLGISPIPKKVCNYSCIYCQLGRTNHMSNTRQMFFNVKDIIDEFDEVKKNNIHFDVVTIVGEGEPTLYLGLGDIIKEIHKRTDKAIAIVTNGALLYDRNVQSELSEADIVMPTLDAYDVESFKKINRPHGSLEYKKVSKGLEEFSKLYKGQLWLEIMLMKDINDDKDSIEKYKKMLSKINYDKLYLNTPVRPPAEKGVFPVYHEDMNKIAEYLGGFAIDALESEGFHSEIEDDYEAVLSIIKRHPMNQFEIEGFLKMRKCREIENRINELKSDENIESIEYKGYITFRLK